jgi:glutamate synthase (ferredoxin)
VRNSGLTAVVEALGDHGCEYMTGGRVVVLGRTGRNFAAGMSGGIAYLLDETGDFPSRCNLQMVGLERMEDLAELEVVRELIERHAQFTGSQRAAFILARWEDYGPKFVKVMPKDCKRVLEALARATQAGLGGEASVLAAFEENARDLARVGGT